MTQFLQVENLPEKEVLPGFRGRFIHSEELTFAYWSIDADAVLPEHSHEHEQTAHMLAGKFELTVNGKTEVLEPGSVAVIPSNCPHSGRAITDCTILDVFFPKREDYL